MDGPTLPDEGRRDALQTEDHRGLANPGARGTPGPRGPLGATVRSQKIREDWLDVVGDHAPGAVGQRGGHGLRGGGLSGVAIFPRTLELVNLFSDMDLTILATGGISTIHHLNAVRDAGASLYGMATSLIMDPYCIPRINQKLSKQF